MIRVVAENGEALSKPEPTINADVVAHLERLLDRAKGGLIDTIAFVAWGHHGSDSGYAGIEEFGDGVYLLGMLRRVEGLIITRVETLAAPVKEYPQP